MSYAVDFGCYDNGNWSRDVLSKVANVELLCSVIMFMSLDLTWRLGRNCYGTGRQVSGNFSTPLP